MFSKFLFLNVLTSNGQSPRLTELHIPKIIWMLTDTSYIFTLILWNLFFKHECHMLHHLKFIPFNSITACYGIKICMIINYTDWENIISWWDWPAIWLLFQYHDASIVDWRQLCIEASAVCGLFQNGRISATTHMHHSVSPGPPPLFSGLEGGVRSQTRHINNQTIWDGCYNWSTTADKRCCDLLW